MGIGWILFIVIEICFMFWAIFYYKSRHTKNEKRKKVYQKIFEFMVNVMATLSVLIAIYLIGLAWYYLCGGILVFDVAETLGDKILYGAISSFCTFFLVVLVAAIGLRLRR